MPYVLARMDRRHSIWLRKVRVHFLTRHWFGWASEIRIAQSFNALRLYNHVGELIQLRSRQARRSFVSPARIGVLAVPPALRCQDDTDHVVFAKTFDLIAVWYSDAVTPPTGPLTRSKTFYIYQHC